jgi:hypothetical protein
MAAYRSYAIVARIRHSASAKQAKKNICTAQPWNEVLFLEDRKFTSILGAMVVEQLMSKKDKLMR